ncbi:MAG: hypothetical protein HYV07_28905 [Deltaproteobacteria bacterium]|nr:hypothetical protein [Deltaproteobacteria bacterium]
MAEWIALADRLPGGLAQAARVWIVGSVPPDAQELAEGSRWYSLGNDLLFLAAGRASRDRAERDLLLYQALADRLAVDLLGRPEVIEALAGIPGSWVDPYFGARPGELASLGAEGLRELETIARGGVSLDVAIDPAISAERSFGFGVALGRRAASTLPPGPVYVVATDEPSAIDLFSPLELGPWLAEWLRGAPDDWPAPGLEQALREGDPTLEAAVARHLATIRPALGRSLDATRPTLDREPGVESSSVSLLELAARLELPRVEASLWVISGAAEGVRGALEVVLETGRVTGIGAVFSSRLPGIVLARSAHTQSDGHIFSSNVLETASRKRRELTVAESVDVDAAEASGLLEVARSVRRATARGHLDPSVPFAGVLFSGASARTLAEAACPPRALRLALELVIAAERSASKSARTVRFRA